MAAIPRYRQTTGPALLSAGFRPFFLLSGLWACVAIPLWVAAFGGMDVLPSEMPASVWHVHEMVFGYGMATVAGFLLTAVPNWTGRMPLQGLPLAGLVVLWAAGRAAVFGCGWLGLGPAAALDLAFPLVFTLSIAREVIAGRNWRNLPVLAALTLLLAANLLVHLGLVAGLETEALGNRLGIATLLGLIGLVGGRIIPSFTRNWMTKQRPGLKAPASLGLIDQAAMAVTILALAAWAAVPDSAATAWLALAAGIANAVRLARWRGLSVLAEPLLWVLHLGYAWLPIGLFLVAGSYWLPQFLPPTAALHALTAGAIGTMTLAVMTRASLGHTGRALTAGPGTTTVFLLVTAATLFRLMAPAGGEHYLTLIELAASAWSGAFGLFVVLYAPLLARPRVVKG